MYCEMLATIRLAHASLYGCHFVAVMVRTFKLCPYGSIQGYNTKYFSKNNSKNVKYQNFEKFIGIFFVAKLVYSQNFKELIDINSCIN